MDEDDDAAVFKIAKISDDAETEDEEEEEEENVKVSQRKNEKFICSHPDCLLSEDATFDSAWSFTRHMRVHNNDLPFQCNFCQKRFVQKCSRDRHQAKHSKERPWDCVFCDKKFKLKEYRTQHLAKQHSDILEDIQNFKNANPQHTQPVKAVKGQIQHLHNKLEVATNFAKIFAKRLAKFEIGLKPEEKAFVVEL